MITHKQIASLGMVIEEWTYESCIAQIGEGDNWATIYFMESKEKGKDHATVLLNAMKTHYEGIGKTFGSSVALSASMKHLLVKLNIPEY